MSKDDISSWAQQNRINVSFVESANDTIPAGSIISISVNENDRLNPGDTITVEVSTGPADQGEDRYNAQPKEDPPVNVTPPADNTVSGGNPTSPTTPSDNQSVTPAPEPEPTPDPVRYSVPKFPLADLQGDSPEVLKERVNYIVTGARIPGKVTYVVEPNEFPGVASITVNGNDITDNTTVTDASEIVCVIYYLD